MFRKYFRRSNNSFKREILARRASVLENSRCELKFIKKAGRLHSVIIELTGPARSFPSTSNDTRIRYVKGQARRGHTAGAIGRMRAVKALYELAKLDSGIPDVGFGKQLVSVLVGCSKHYTNNFFDSHNQNKPIGDFLQAVKVFDNDGQAEIYCYKKTEYPDTEPLETTTTIIIQLRENVQVLNEAYFTAIKGAACF